MRAREPEPDEESIRHNAYRERKRTRRRDRYMGVIGPDSTSFERGLAREPRAVDHATYFEGTFLAQRSPVDPSHSFYLNGGEIFGEKNGVTVASTYVQQSIVNNVDTSPVVDNGVLSSIVTDVIHMSSHPDADGVLMETFLESYSECLLTTPQYKWIPEPIDHVSYSSVDPLSTQLCLT